MDVQNGIGWDKPQERESDEVHGAYNPTAKGLTDRPGGIFLFDGSK